MSTTIFQAPEYDPARDQRRRRTIIIIIVAVLLLALVGYRFRNWPEERVVSHFFEALQQHKYEDAYAIWIHDPAWKQHPEKYTRYPYHEFYQDWGPGGEWGLINSYRVDGSTRSGSGVVVVVTVNQRA